MHRSAPDWYKLEDYQQCADYNCQEWFHALKHRRNSKSLFDLIQAEPNIFTHEFDPQLFWLEFSQSLERKIEDTPINSRFSFIDAPKKIHHYSTFRILPLFDLTHWFEIHHQELPSIDELDAWVYPDIEKNIRYHVNDSKKVLKRALLECDALMFNSAMTTLEK